MQKKDIRLKDRTGETNTNFQGLKTIIISYINARNIKIQFEDGTEMNTSYRHFKEGIVKNLNHPVIFGIGYYGIGKYKAWGGVKLNKNYNMWTGMIKRCYDEKMQEKHPTYKDVTVCEEWHNFQNFAAWFEDNYIEGFELDKDIICPDCRVYSPETCCFVPREINLLFKNITKRNLPLGVYYLRGRYQVSTPTNDKSTYIGFYKTVEEALIAHKTAKEKYMKEAAEKWKDKIDSRVYDALMNYTIDIEKELEHTLNKGAIEGTVEGT